MPSFSPIPEILDELRAGRMIVLTDDEDRENEGDLVLPAQHITPGLLTFMLKEAKGYLCLSLTAADCDRLDLHDQTAVNTSARATPFTVSIDGHPKHGFTTGVSAAERANTIKLAINPSSTPSDFVRPGHINPLRARNGGVLVRTGQTEGSVDLCKLAGLTPAALIIEIMRDDGEMARVPDLEKFCAQHHIKMCSVAQIIEYRLAQESLVKRLPPFAGTPIRTSFGTFNLIAFESLVDPHPHLALTVGDVGQLDTHNHPIESDAPTLVRMHRRNLLGDIFHDLDSSPESDSSTADTLHASMQLIQKEGRGVIVYLRPEGQGEDLAARLQQIRRPSYDTGADNPDLTHPQAIQHRNEQERGGAVGVGCQILRELGVTNLRLITHHTKDIPTLDAFGLHITEHVSPTLPPH